MISGCEDFAIKEIWRRKISKSFNRKMEKPKL
jgi:hypothetical protein